MIPPRAARWWLLLTALTGGCTSFLIRQAPPAPPTITARIGNPEERRWSPTTWDAASTPEHRRTLERARPNTIVGEVVDVSCFLQLGKRGEAHVACGQKCVRNGQPIGLLTDSGQLYLVIPEEHHPRRDGAVSLRDSFVELMGKRVQLFGMVIEDRHHRAIFVRTLSTPAS